jgi:hypothetical protein
MAENEDSGDYHRDTVPLATEVMPSQLMAQQEESREAKTFTFGHRANRSYFGQLSRNVKYNNNRKPHVETSTPNLEGRTFRLGRRSSRVVGGNVAVMYEIEGVMNGGFPAHITVYFGPASDASNY